nr:ribosomal protein S13 [Ipomoea batatas]
MSKPLANFHADFIVDFRAVMSIFLLWVKTLPTRQLFTVLAIFSESPITSASSSSIVRYRLGISGNIKIKELTKYQIDQIEQMIGQDHVVHWELKRGERADIERLISISCYRGIRHQDGAPLRGQRTHTNARTCRKLIRK